MDLRTRVVAAVDKGLGKAVVAETFGVSVRTINRSLRLRRESGSLAPKPIPGRPSVKGAALIAGLEPQLAANADATLPEHCALWEGAGGEPVSEATMSRALKELGWPLKKSAEGGGARRGGPRGVAGAGRRHRPVPVRVRGRVRQQHRDGAGAGAAG